MISILENVFKTFIRPLVPKRRPPSDDKLFEKERQEMRRRKDTRRGGDGDSIKGADEKNEKIENVMKKYDTFNDNKYDEKHFYI